MRFRQAVREPSFWLGAVAAVLIGVLAGTVPVQAAPPVERVQATLVANFDVTTAGYTYTAFADRNAVASANFPLTGVLGNGTGRNLKVKTTGSSTSLTANTASTSPFQGLGAGDLLLFTSKDYTTTLPSLGVEFERVIVTFTDVNNVVVNSAIDLSDGYTFRFKKLLTGTDAVSGWFSVDGFRSFNVQFDVTTINATSITATLECRVSKFAGANTLFTNAFTSTGSASIYVTAPQEDCRIGWKLAGDGGAQVVAASFSGDK